MWSIIPRQELDDVVSIIPRQEIECVVYNPQTGARICGQSSTDRESKARSIILSEECVIGRVQPTTVS